MCSKAKCNKRAMAFLVVPKNFNFIYYLLVYLFSIMFLTENCGLNKKVSKFVSILLHFNSILAWLIICIILEAWSGLVLLFGIVISMPVLWSSSSELKDIFQYSILSMIFPVFSLPSSASISQVCFKYMLTLVSRCIPVLG